jgi:hypothetical protein
MHLGLRRLIRTIPVALIVLATWSGATNAQTNGNSGQHDSSDAANQFKVGAQQVGEGAQRFGEGIEQGAILTWEALKAGASAVADKFEGGHGSPKNTSAPPPQPN